MAIFMDLLTAPRFQQDRFDKTKDNVLQADIARLTAEIETLGPVNLAALPIDLGEHVVS